MCKKGLFFLGVLLFSFFKAGAEEPACKSICLNMIVKNESHVIQRCLESVKPLIDHWVIVDTGSTDGTQEIIKTFLKDIPGELYERPWVDFGHNRQEALLLAKGKGDYLLFMDADERLVYSPEFSRSSLDKDYYYVPVQDTTPDVLSYNRFLLVNNHLSWEWKDVLHEYLVVPPEVKSSETFKSVVCLTDSDGFRSKDPKKYYKDAAVLEKALEKDPENARYVFYLAQAYANAKEYELALKNYERRASIKGVWDKEIYWSLYVAGCIQQSFSKPAEMVIKSYTKAYEQEPTRAEPLFRLANYYNERKEYLLGYAVAKLAVALPVPQDEMFILKWVYDYGALCALSDSAFFLGRYEEAASLFQKILSKKELPSDMRENVQKHLSFALSKLPKAGV